MMARPRFSVVIPTRDRTDTLPFTLRTCLDQDFDDYEVIVSDNGSDESARTVVEQLNSSKVRHVRTPRPLAMTDSWEFAINLAEGEYVTLLGSDDGLLGHALRELDRMLRLVDTRALRWECAFYSWSNLPPQEHSRPNQLRVPLTQSNGSHALRRVDASELIVPVAHSRITYSHLPMIYSAAIRHDLVAELRRRTGRVFKSEAPDIYSAFAFGYLAGTFHSTDAPLAINALSGRSTGIALHFLESSTPIAQDFRALNAAAQYDRHPWAPQLHVIAASVADSFLRVREDLFPDDPRLVLDRRELISTCLNHVRRSDAQQWDAAKAIARRSLADDPALLDWFDRTFSDPTGGWPAKPPSTHLPGYDGVSLDLAADTFGVADVHGAAKLCEQLLGYRARGVPVQVDPVDHLAVLQRAADERLALIHRLNTICEDRLRVINLLDGALEAATKEGRGTRS